MVRIPVRMKQFGIRTKRILLDSIIIAEQIVYRIYAEYIRFVDSIHLSDLITYFMNKVGIVVESIHLVALFIFSFIARLSEEALDIADKLAFQIKVLTSAVVADVISMYKMVLPSDSVSINDLIRVIVGLEESLINITDKLFLSLREVLESIDIDDSVEYISMKVSSTVSMIDDLISKSIYSLIESALNVVGKLILGLKTATGLTITEDVEELGWNEDDSVSTSDDFGCSVEIPCCESSCYLCQICNAVCYQCNTSCYTCYTCDKVDTCVTCVTCDKCNVSCYSCYTCDASACYTCNLCDVATCDVCYTCQSSCYTCQKCNASCYSCNTCQGICYTCDFCNTSCYICDTCQIGVVCDATCDVNCQNCYSCDTCNVTCQSCYTCTNSCYLLCQNCNTCQWCNTSQA